MSAAEMKNFEAQLALLSFAEQLSLMELLAKIMQQRQEAQAVPVRPKKRQFGSAKGKFAYPVDFDEDNEEVAHLFGAV